MAQEAAVRYVTEEEYFALEEKSDIKHEYFAGEIFAMAGGSFNHSVIATNLSRHLGNLLKGRCLVGNSDLRTKVEATSLLTYPDVTVICGTPSLAHRPSDTLLNPTLIAEVLSPSTELYDRTIKFEHYKLIPSLRTYLLVSQTAPHLDQYTRMPDLTWTYGSASSLNATLELPALGIMLSLSEIFDGVKFETQPGGFMRPLHG